MKKLPHEALMFRPSGIKHHAQQTELKKSSTMTYKNLQISNASSRGNRMKINA